MFYIENSISNVQNAYKSGCKIEFRENPTDPWEPINRPSFLKGVDYRAIVETKPLGKCTERVHCELITAWAQGAKIQWKNLDTWTDIENPIWQDQTLYRLKPKNSVSWIRVYRHENGESYFGSHIYHSLESSTIDQVDDKFSVIQIEISSDTQEVVSCINVKTD